MNGLQRTFRLHQHPWLAMAVELLVGLIVLIIFILAANLAGVPVDAPYRPLLTPTLAHVAVLFVVVPFVLKLPGGKANIREYLADIRLAKMQPFFPLVGVGLSCTLLALLALSTQSLLFRAWQGQPINACFLMGMIDLRADLPLSISWVNSFPAVFEEITWRGVILALFMRRYAARKSVVITALGFGLFHLVNLLGGVPVGFVIRQVIMSTGFGLFYGYLVLRTDSLLPAMLFHLLVNMFIGSFTYYTQNRAPDPALVVLLALNIPLTTGLLIQWVRFLSSKWLPGSQPSGYSQFDLDWAKRGVR